MTARGGHGGLGGGGGSGGRIAIDTCTDKFYGEFDLAGGVAMLPLRQVQLLGQAASFFSTAHADRAFNNFTQAGEPGEPWTAPLFQETAEAVAAAAAGTGDRILRSKYADDALPVFLSGASGTVGRYTSWPSTSIAYTASRCQIAKYRNARSTKVSVASAWRVADLFSNTTAQSQLSHMIGDATLGRISDTLVNAYTSRDREKSASNVYSAYGADMGDQQGADPVGSNVNIGNGYVCLLY